MSLGGCGLRKHLPPFRLTHRPVSEGAPAAAAAAVREKKEEGEKHVQMELESSGGGEEERRREGSREEEEKEGEKGGGVEKEGEREEEEEGEVERVVGGETVAGSCRDDFEESPRPKQPHRREEVVDMEEEIPHFPAHPFSYFPPDAGTEEHGETLETAPSPSPPHPLPMQLDTQPAAALLIQQTLQQQSLAFPPEGSHGSLPFSQGGWLGLPPFLHSVSHPFSSHSPSLPSFPAVVAAQLEELQSLQMAQVGHTPSHTPQPPPPVPPLTDTPMFCLSLQATQGHTHKPHPCSQHSQKSMTLGVQYLQVYLLTNPTPLQFLGTV